MSIDLLIKKIKETGNPTVVGLDPHISYVPEDVLAKFAEGDQTNAILEFNKGLIDALCDIVPAVKPQAAYYEMHGWRGVRVLAETVDYAKSKGMYVIADGKRNDIGSTAEAYAEAYLKTSVLDGHFHADSLTVNPYLGTDGIAPFVAKCEDGASIFVLVKTSNPSSGELQDLICAEKPIYEHVANLVNTWGKTTIGKNGYSSVGAVVGATYPEQAERLRELMPRTYFLVPGYGAQGGTAKDVAKSFNSDGLGAIVNASRSIMCAYKKDGGDYQSAARAEAIRMKNDIVNAI
ncbi:MAG: orotidine-5'-phosphate decarboxylase [Oscillospiraceae bacterium]|nr:orotidine-5'-phosphate decarboxylase [Oscillospiraceae bacterium]